MATATYTATATTAATATARSSPTSKPVPPPPTKLSAPPPPPPPSLPTPPPVTPTPTFCPTPTATIPPTPTATATYTATATASPSSTTSTPTPTATSAPTATASPTASGGCVTCPYYTGNNPSQSSIRDALYAAADTYHLPRNLLLAVAWQESKWHQDVTSCDGGVGLMQIQYYYVSYFNSLSIPACGFAATGYDATTLAGNANLGAKVLKYLYCYYTFGGPYGGTSTQPADGSSAYYYQQAGLQYPDTLNADGTPNAKSFCAAVINDTATYPQYQALPSTTAQPWSCPYSATTGDSTLLDLVLSAYNAGPGAISTCGCIPNPGYVQYVETYIPEFAAGTLP